MNEEYLLGFGARGDDRGERRPFADDRPARPALASRDGRAFAGREAPAGFGFRRDDRYAPRPLREEREGVESEGGSSED
jgi:hypothetical protein